MRKYRDNFSAFCAFAEVRDLLEKEENMLIELKDKCNGKHESRRDYYDNQIACVRRIKNALMVQIAEIGKEEKK